MWLYDSYYSMNLTLLNIGTFLIENIVVQAHHGLALYSTVSPPWTAEEQTIVLTIPEYLVVSVALTLSDWKGEMLVLV